MINYIEIAGEIESLAVDKGVFFFCILIGAIGILILLYGLHFFCIDLNDDLIDKIKSLFLGTVILFISGLVFGFCLFKIETSKNYHKKEVVEYMKKKGIKEIDPEKFIRNVNKVKKFDGVIPEKFYHYTRYGRIVDRDSYYNALLNDYYNNVDNKEKLFESLE